MSNKHFWRKLHVSGRAIVAFEVYYEWSNPCLLYVGPFGETDMISFEFGIQNKMLDRGDKYFVFQKKSGYHWRSHTFFM